MPGICFSKKERNSEQDDELKKKIDNVKINDVNFQEKNGEAEDLVEDQLCPEEILIATNPKAEPTPKNINSQGEAKTQDQNQNHIETPHFKSVNEDHGQDKSQKSEKSNHNQKSNNEIKSNKPLTDKKMTIDENISEIGDAHPNALNPNPGMNNPKGVDKNRSHQVIPPSSNTNLDQGKRPTSNQEFPGDTKSKEKPTNGKAQPEAEPNQNPQEKDQVGYTMYMDDSTLDGKQTDDSKAANKLLGGVTHESFINIKFGTFSKDYSTGKILGEGAHGKVCLVTHKSSGVTRAMKAIKKSQVNRDQEQKLLAEVSIQKQLDHPNIVKLYELYQDYKYYYLITEYSSGGELFDKIKTMHTFSEKQAADYMKQILSAIFYCHERGIVHRDLKPENLLLESDRDDAQLKVIDFGVSGKYAKGTKMREKYGTPYYIAPEVQNRNYDEKCDVWSCGVILYIQLCGYPPFNGGSDVEIMNNVKIGKYVFDDLEWLHISVAAKSLIAKMLLYDTKKRPSAKECYSDPWIQGNATPHTLDSNVVANLSGYQSTNKFRSAVITFMATQIAVDKDKEELTKMFKALDKDGNGILNREELIKGYMEINNGELDRAEASIKVDDILRNVDSNNSGEIDFSEFLVASMNKEKLLCRTKIEQAFKMFDINGDGYIDHGELSKVVGGVAVDEKQWKEIIAEIDTDGDGMINMDEFVDLLLKVGI